MFKGLLVVHYCAERMLDIRWDSGANITNYFLQYINCSRVTRIVQTLRQDKPA